MINLFQTNSMKFEEPRCFFESEEDIDSSLVNRDADYKHVCITDEKEKFKNSQLDDLDYEYIEQCPPPLRKKIKFSDCMPCIQLSPIVQDGEYFSWSAQRFLTPIGVISCKQNYEALNSVPYRGLLSRIVKAPKKIKIPISRRIDSKDLDLKDYSVFIPNKQIVDRHGSFCYVDVNQSLYLFLFCMKRKYPKFYARFDTNIWIFIKTFIGRDLSKFYGLIPDLGIVRYRLKEKEAAILLEGKQIVISPRSTLLCVSLCTQKQHKAQLWSIMKVLRKLDTELQFLGTGLPEQTLASLDSAARLEAVPTNKKNLRPSTIKDYVKEPFIYVQISSSDSSIVDRYIIFSREERKIGLGRAYDETNDIILPDDPTCSRRQAYIFFDGSSWRYEDRGSSNGSWITAKPNVTIPLTHGSAIEIGTDRYLVSHM